LTFSGSSWRIDCYEYRQGNQTITFGGEGGSTVQLDINIPPNLYWDADRQNPLDSVQESQVLRRITAAIQSMGVGAAFFFEDPNDPRINEQSIPMKS
jgi:hypothetical protein